MAKVKVLFFIDGPLPDAREMQFSDDGRKNGVVIAFRNIRHIADEHRPEECDGVHASDEKFIPKIYKDKPRIEEALKKHLEEVERRRKLVGDVPAPTQQTQPEQIPEEPPKQPEPDKKVAGWAKNQ